MAARDHWRQGGIFAFTSGEDITNCIDAQLATSVTTPLYEQIPTISILVGQGLTIAATGRSSPVLRHIHQA
jgi:hypothetical protein